MKYSGMVFQEVELADKLVRLAAKFPAVQALQPRENKSCGKFDVGQLELARTKQRSHIRRVAPKFVVFCNKINEFYSVLRFI